ncbi:MAG: Veg family protein [Eubacteriales bacterium]
MIKNTSGINDAKKAVNEFAGKDVEVKVNLGRNKELCYCGKLTGIYPALFKVSPFEKDFKGKTSYSYSEFLCGTVKLKSLG